MFKMSKQKISLHESSGFIPMKKVPAFLPEPSLPMRFGGTSPVARLFQRCTIAVLIKHFLAGSSTSRLK